MSVTGFTRKIGTKLNLTCLRKLVSSRFVSSLVNPEVQEPTQEQKDKIENSSTSVPLEYRFIYPEFLPDPTPEWRNPVREKLERMDMLCRREHINIPEFYVGTIMAVTRSNIHEPDKLNRFLGICIQRRNCGLRASFTLRNVIDHLGTEMEFMMYDPTIHKIEVLRLEKRLDDELLYLRDALPEYSTFPLDMETEILPEGTPVPINKVKVKLRPQPWVGRWEIKNFEGIDEDSYKYLNQAKAERREKLKTPWEKYDLMKQYRKTIPEEDQKEIFTEVYSTLHHLELTRKKLKRKRVFVKPKKTG
uniref:Large ribosomal subunit protein bL19m n=1 Tax=Clastoptera arizonana TaxID=38151 RepID=A0A1B6EE67_9HEMI